MRAAREQKRNGGGAETHGKDNKFQMLLDNSMDGRDQLYDGESQSHTSVVSTHPFKMRQENAKVYNSYLQKSHARRLSKKTEKLRQSIMAYRGVDPNDPTSYDFTIEHDLDEPYLKVPKGGEKLWLADSADNKRARPVLDENRLILKKKFGKVPAHRLRCVIVQWNWTLYIFLKSLLATRLLISVGFVLAAVLRRASVC